MANIKALALLLLASLLLVSVTAITNFETNKKDPQFEQCKEMCKQQAGHDKRLLKQCQEMCKEQHKHHDGDDGDGDDGDGDDGDGDDGDGDDTMEEWNRGQSPNQQQQVESPYVFDDRHFFKFKRQHGSISVLQHFRHHSKLLRGIENYRLSILETDPQTFVKPNHWDADEILVVLQGNGSISTITPERKQSFLLRRGDIFLLPAGINAYVINRDNREKLIIALFLRPVANASGEIQQFYGTGGRQPRSYFETFSIELLEAAFKTKRERLQRWLGQGGHEAIMRASEQQIRAMSHQLHEGESSDGKVNLFHKHPVHSNNFGQLREVKFNDYKQFENFDVTVSFANVTQGGMATPSYNSRATKISLVVKGEGYFEMACPHLPSRDVLRSETTSQPQPQPQPHRQQQQGTPLTYQKVSARLKAGMVFVAQAGHPVIMAAAKDQNLEVLCFEVNAKNNRRFQLAGSENIFNKMDREAKELGFELPFEEVEEILRNQDQDWFVEGPRQLPQQRQGLADE